MVGSRKNRTGKQVIDPITGEVLADKKLPPIVIGDEVLPEELDDEITGPEDPPPSPRARREGTQHIVVIDDPTDITEEKLHEMWEALQRDRR